MIRLLRSHLIICFYKPSVKSTKRKWKDGRQFLMLTTLFHQTTAVGTPVYIYAIQEIFLCGTDSRAVIQAIKPHF